MADGIVVVTGGTRFLDWQFVYRSRDEFHASRPIVEMVNGMAPMGVDLFCYQWATRKGIHVREFPADWTRDEKKAGVIRNQEMIDQNPDISVGLVFPGHRGTIDMTRRLRKAGIERVFFETERDPFAEWG